MYHEIFIKNPVKNTNLKNKKNDYHKLHVCILHFVAIFLYTHTINA